MIDQCSEESRHLLLGYLVMVDLEIEWLRYTAVSKRKWTFQWDSSGGSGLRGVLLYLDRSPDGQLAHDLFCYCIRLVRWWIVGDSWSTGSTHSAQEHSTRADLMYSDTGHCIISSFLLIRWTRVYIRHSDGETWLRVIGDEQLLQLYWRGPNSKKRLNFLVH